MSTFCLREFGNIDDPKLIRYCVVTQGMRSVLCQFTEHVFSQRIPMTVPTLAALAGISRLTEGSLSIEILCAKNRPRDAAILLLSLHELTIDLQYMAQDPTRALIWIDHQQRHAKPWKVRSQLRALYSGRELEAEEEIYRDYSMAKHSNPVAKLFGFPMAVSRDALELDLATDNSPHIRTHLFGLCSYLHRSGKAAASIWASQRVDVGAFTVSLEASARLVSEYLHEDILSMLRAEPAVPME